MEIPPNNMRDGAEGATWTNESCKHLKQIFLVAQTIWRDMIIPIRDDFPFYLATCTERSRSIGYWLFLFESKAYSVSWQSLQTWLLATCTERSRSIGYCLLNLSKICLQTALQTWLLDTCAERTSCAVDWTHFVRRRWSRSIGYSLLL